MELTELITADIGFTTFNVSENDVQYVSFFVDLIHFEGKLAFSFIHLLTSCLSHLIVFI